MKLRLIAVLFLLCGAAFAVKKCPSGQHYEQVPEGTTGDTKVIQGMNCQCRPNGGGGKGYKGDSNSNARSSSQSFAQQKQQQQQSQNQQQQQSAQAQANGNGDGNGNNSNNYATTENYAAAKIPVASAYAPTTIPTVPCFKGFGAGVQTVPFGASFGGGKIDKNCATLEAARQAPSKLARCKVYVSDEYVRKAGVTLQDCMEEPDVPEIPADTPPAHTPVIPAVVVPIAPVTPVAPIVVSPIVELLPLGICTFPSATQCGKGGDPARPTLVCNEMLASAQHQLATHPGYEIRLTGNVNQSEAFSLAYDRTVNVKRQLVEAGVNPNQILLEIGREHTRTVSITLVPPSTSILIGNTNTAAQ